MTAWRPTHHLGGVRIGEASHPGPDEPRTPQRRLRRKTSLAAFGDDIIPSMIADVVPVTPGETQLDSQTSVEPDRSATIAVADDASMPHEDSDLMPPLLAIPAAQVEPSQDPEVPQPRADAALPAPLKVTLAEGGDAELKCNFLPSVKSWRWQLLPRRLNCVRESRVSPVMALSAWLRSHEEKLAPASVAAVHELHASIELAVPPAQPEQPLVAPRARHMPLQATARRIPEPVVCDYIASLSLADLLSADIRCQKKLPKSSVHELSLALVWLHDLRLNTSLSDSQQHAAALVLACAPRVLWPEPVRQEHEQRLHSHACPHLIAERLALLWAGQWEVLIRAATTSNIERADVEEPLQPSRPGLLSPAQCARAKVATSQNRLSAAWKQLWSYGVAGKDEDCCNKVKEKLAPGRVQQQVTAFMMDETERAALRGYMTDAMWKSLLPAFRPGRAPDACGWSQAIWATLASHPTSAKAMRRFCEDFLACELPGPILDILHCHRAVPLFKNEEGSVRPICIPTCFRKAIALLSSKTWASQINDHISKHQFGNGQVFGVPSMSSSVQHAMRHKESWIFLQLDVANAFPSIRSQSVSTVLREAHPMLEAAARRWLHGNSCVLVPQSRGQRAVQQHLPGLPQGDPLSAHAFALVMSSIEKDLSLAFAADEHGGTPPFQMWSYLDDVVLALAPSVAPAIWEKLTSLMATHGLSVQTQKTHVYSPSGDADLFMQQVDIPGHPAEGLVICGTPVLALTPDLQDRRDLAVGRPRFVHSWLAKKHDILKRKCACLVALSTALSSVGQHVALHLLRASLLPSMFHIFASSGGGWMDAWSAEVTQTLWTCASDILAWTVPTVDVQRVISLPPRYGGLGITDLSLEAPIFFMAQTLALRSNGLLPVSFSASASSSDLGWSSDEQHQLNRLHQMCQCPVTQVLKRSEAQLALDGLAHAGKKLRGYLYDMKTVGQAPVPAFTQPLGRDTTLPHVDWRNLNSLALAWWTNPTQFLENDLLQLALRSRVGLPLQHPESRCGNLLTSRAAACGHPLDCDGVHSNSCCRTGVAFRHNLLRDELVSIVRSLGWVAAIEQDVLCPPAAPSQQRAHAQRHKCDAVIMNHSGKTWALEVGFTATPRVVSAQDALKRYTCQKVSRHGLRADRTLPNGEQLVPFVSNNWGTWTAEACKFLLMVAEAKVQHSAADVGQQPRAVQQQRLQLAARLQLCCLKGQWRILRQSAVLLSEGPG